MIIIMLLMCHVYFCDCIFYDFVDKMKDAVIAKVAAQAADFYKEANAAFQVSTVRQQLEKVSQSYLWVFSFLFNFLFLTIISSTQMYHNTVNGFMIAKTNLKSMKLVKAIQNSC